MLFHFDCGLIHSWNACPQTNGHRIRPAESSQFNSFASLE